LYKKNIRKTKEKRETHGRSSYTISDNILVLLEDYTQLEDFMAIGLNLQFSIHLPIHTPHLHTLHSYKHLSPPSNQQEKIISPPNCDATRGTCIGTGGPIMLQEEIGKLQEGH